MSVYLHSLENSLSSLLTNISIGSRSGENIFDSITKYLLNDKVGNNNYEHDDGGILGNNFFGKNYDKRRHHIIITSFKDDDRWEIMNFRSKKYLYQMMIERRYRLQKEKESIDNQIQITKKSISDIDTKDANLEKESIQLSKKDLNKDLNKDDESSKNDLVNNLNKKSDNESMRSNLAGNKGIVMAKLNFLELERKRIKHALDLAKRGEKYAYDGYIFSIKMIQKSELQELPHSCTYDSKGDIRWIKSHCEKISKCGWDEWKSLTCQKKRPQEMGIFHQEYDLIRETGKLSFQFIRAKKLTQKRQEMELEMLLDQLPEWKRAELLREPMEVEIKQWMNEFLPLAVKLLNAQEQAYGRFCDNRNAALQQSIDIVKNKLQYLKFIDAETRHEQDQLSKALIEMRKEEKIVRTKERQLLDQIRHEELTQRMRSDIARKESRNEESVQAIIDRRTEGMRNRMAQLQSRFITQRERTQLQALQVTYQQITVMLSKQIEELKSGLAEMLIEVAKMSPAAKAKAEATMKEAELDAKQIADAKAKVDPPGRTTNEDAIAEHDKQVQNEEKTAAAESKKEADEKAAEDDQLGTQNKAEEAEGGSAGGAAEKEKKAKEDAAENVVENAEQKDEKKTRDKSDKEKKQEEAVKGDNESDRESKDPSDDSTDEKKDEMVVYNNNRDAADDSASAGGAHAMTSITDTTLFQKLFWQWDAFLMEGENLHEELMRDMIEKSTEYKSHKDLDKSLPTHIPHYGDGLPEDAQRFVDKFSLGGLKSLRNMDFHEFKDSAWESMILFKDNAHILAKHGFLGVLDGGYYLLFSVPYSVMTTFYVVTKETFLLPLPVQYRYRVEDFLYRVDSNFDYYADYLTHHRPYTTVQWILYYLGLAERPYDGKIPTSRWVLHELGTRSTMNHRMLGAILGMKEYDMNEVDSVFNKLIASSAHKKTVMRRVITSSSDIRLAIFQAKDTLERLKAYQMVEAEHKDKLSREGVVVQQASFDVEFFRQIECFEQVLKDQKKSKDSTSTNQSTDKDKSESQKKDCTPKFTQNNTQRIHAMDFYSYF